MAALLILFGLLVAITLLKGSFYLTAFVARLLWNVGPYVVLLIVALGLYALTIPQ